MNSWKTTLSGVLIAVGAMLPLVSACLEGDCDWTAIFNGALVVLGALGLGTAARDNDKSSESVGAV